MSTEMLETVRSEVDARILVVDDEPEAALLVADALREADPSWDVVSETDPKQALGRLADERFDCLVTDLVMPAMGGLNLAQRARESDDEVILIAITGRGTLESGVEALRMGFADYIEKPFKIEAVQRAVCRALRRRRRQQAMERRFAELAQANAKLEAVRAQLDRKLEIAGHDLVLSNRRMARRMEELALTADVPQSLSGVIELEDQLGLCAELIGDRVACRTSTVALYEAREAAVGLMVRAWPEAQDPPALCWLRTPLQSGVVCRAAQARKCVHIDDIEDSVLVDPQEKELWRDGHLLVVPIPYQGSSIGAAILHRPPENKDFNVNDIKRATGLVNVMGPGIRSAKVHHQQRCQVYASLEAIAATVERRTPYLKGHSTRVLAYVQPIAEALNLTQSQIGCLQIAARLHDIGRVATPDSTLDHPGPLTEAQWEIIRRHPAEGAEFLEPMDFFGEVGQIIRAHHESYDGTGYPDQKAGEEIPLVARVIAVADAFDAMTSPRPHREALSVDEARRQMRQLAGEQFDPRVAEAFLDLPDEVVHDIQESHR